MVEHVKLRDGSSAELRPIEPGDREALAAGFDRLGPDSRYKRFLSPVAKLTEAQLTYLTDVDHHDHEALGALVDGAAVGVGRFIRARPGSTQAEVAVTVADDWQGRGVGRELLRGLRARARDEGIDTFTATVLGTNQASVDMLAALGEVSITDVGDGQMELEVELEGDSLAILLRHAASGVMDFIARLPPTRG